ncbi:type I-F CRISPR-associated protein Csy2 [Terasakiispira papahanaumokuakeensis]|uniref:Type I-F CRISPR-associated protein Csy2 n=1 Tax=Terasakiispira papahanaumokuakeensis TaxID=197479 RepID=A0A1E2V6U7_9GAMM|nr:type I-F CRISPR-associated protein Csy2 [Terasakiispira papahanaumokuakeensis]ODC02707.1 type I-F CRISPR-associated protein Csy2 [Terasakiispira papahanaumokuakeensis]
MNPNDQLHHLLVLPRLRIQNANAISSPMTWGFPAMSAFVGFQHALERGLPESIQIHFDSIAVVCHRLEPQVADGMVAHTFHLTRNPVTKSGDTAAIVEEGRAHLDVTLLLEVSSEGDDLSSFERRQAIADQIFEQVHGMRIAGGSVMPSLSGSHRARPRLINFSDDSEIRQRQWRSLRRQLLPGFALVLRDDLLKEHTQTLQAEDEQATALEAWLDLSRMNHECQITETHDASREQVTRQVHWTLRRPYPGWLVPIPVGYGAISPCYEPGEVAQARDAQVPFQFVESLYSMGEWISPHRIAQPERLMWFVENDLDQGLYRLQNDYAEFIEHD